MTDTLKKQEKEQKYLGALESIKALCLGESSLIANMANATAVLQETFHHWWTGFYIVENEEELVLGPFSGPVACTRIKYGRGVCGTAWAEKRTVIVPDVHQFPGHIACSSASNSEIVVPLWSRGSIVGVIDIDSTAFDTFDEVDEKYLGRIGAYITAYVPQKLISFINSEILPRYAEFDPAHRRDHADYVIEQSLLLAGHYDADPKICYAAAAYHDTGLCKGRETHHLVSGEIIRADAKLREFLSEDEIELAACAAEDHRASSKHEPRSIYGRICAEADRQIDGNTIMRRTIQYGLGHYPELDKEGNWNRTLEHMHEKYAEGGYLKLWIPESDNAVKLHAFQQVIKDTEALRKLFDEQWDILMA